MTSTTFTNFFTPPHCHIQKLADFVQFICFLGTPLSLQVRTFYVHAPFEFEFEGATAGRGQVALRIAFAAMSALSDIFQSS